MRTLLQTLLLALACAGLYSAAVTHNSTNHSVVSRATTTAILADGTEPFPRRPK